MEAYPESVMRAEQAKKPRKLVVQWQLLDFSAAVK